MRLIQSLGVPVYCEAWPSSANMHMAAFGVTAAERMFRRTGLASGETNHIAPQAFAGEVVILVTGNLAGNRELDRNPEKLAELIRDIVHARGFTVFAPIRVLMGARAES